MDVEGERTDIGGELEEEKGKDSEGRPHPATVWLAVRNGVPAEGDSGQQW